MVCQGSILSNSVSDLEILDPTRLTRRLEPPNSVI